MIFQKKYAMLIPVKKDIKVKFSNYFIPTLKEEPSGVDYLSQKLMLKSGMMKQVSSGLFVYLPTFMRVAEKVCKVIHEKMESVNAVPVKFPILVAKEDLVATNRWDAYGDEMFRLKDRNKKEYAISPTNEEYACFMAKNFIKSAKNMPFCVYQIQQKHRDEIRPRGGVMRAREFIMKDAYSFHPSTQSLDEYYIKMENAYKEIFNTFGLDFVEVLADSGAMGGKECHEFMSVCDKGEAEIAVCECGFCANMELAPNGVCPECGKPIAKVLQGNEMGHIFKLKTRYSDPLNLTFINADGKPEILQMGCYGIGVERVICSIIEQNNDARGIAFPEIVAPFAVNIITANMKDEAQVHLSEEIYNELTALGVEVIWDDRADRLGSKLADSELIGIPYNILVGKNATEGKAEFFARCGEKTLLSKEEIIAKYKK